MRTWIFCFGIMLLSVCKVQVQNDPVLAGMIDRSNGEIATQALGRWLRAAKVSTP